MNERIEITILRNLFFNEPYVRKALPFIKEEYFTNNIEKILFREIEKFVLKYKNVPTKETIIIEFNNRKDVREDDYKAVKELVNTLNKEDVDQECC